MSFEHNLWYNEEIKQPSFINETPKCMSQLLQYIWSTSSFIMHTTPLSFWLNSTYFQHVELGLNVFSHKAATPKQATLKFSKVRDTPTSIATTTKTIIEKHMAFEVCLGFKKRFQPKVMKKWWSCNLQLTYINFLVPSPHWLHSLWILP